MDSNCGNLEQRCGAKFAIMLAVSFSAILGSAHCAHADVTISSSATLNMTCSGGVCAPTATKAVLNVSDLENLLASGNVTVTTTGSGGVQANDIDERAVLSWSSSSNLSLDAHRTISVDKVVSVTSLAGVALTTNDGGSGGVLSFGETGSMSFANLSSALTVNGMSFALVNSIAALAHAIAANPAGDYALANAYDASKDGTYKSAPIATTLTGTVEGLGNTISNLSIVTQPKTGGLFGLFALLGSGGTIESVRMTGLKLTADQGVKGGGAVGGLVSENSGTLFDDHVAGTITTNRSPAAGGLTGGNKIGGAIVDSSAKVRVSAPGSVGGLVGGNSGTIILSHADGAVKGGTAGGLVGSNGSGTISQSYATGPVTGGDSARAGGIVGLHLEYGGINNSYATGAVTGGADAEVGGFSGEAGSPIEDSYSTGAVAGGTGSVVGGFSGAECYCTNSDWDTTTSGTDQGTGFGNVSGLIGLTTEQLQSGLPNGFDPKVWAENPNINNGFPYLIANPPPKK